jgi:lysophospholipase L1-like esterase
MVDIHCDYARIFDFFQQSYLLANLLENLGVKYYFFNSFPVEWSRYLPGSFMPEFKKDIDIYHGYNVHNIDDDFFFFLDKRKDQQVHLSDGHPNSKGYKLWADHILNNMQLKGIIE